jgi:hypothetical protein
MYTICLPFSEWHNSDEQHSIEYGAPPNFAFPVHVWLDNHFTGRWNGRRGPRVQLPRRLELLPSDFFWGVGGMVVLRQTEILPIKAKDDRRTAATYST